LSVPTPVIALSLLLVTLLACGNDAAPPDAGTVVVAHDQGIDFGTGRLRDPGNYSNCDLFATANGDGGLKLSTGGDLPTDNRPVTWFRTGGGFPQEFADLGSVPTAPLPAAVDGLVHAKPGYGFLLLTADGDHVRGWLEAASGTSVTLQWARVPAE